MGVAVAGYVLAIAGIAGAAPPARSTESTTQTEASKSATVEEPEYDDYRLSLLAGDAAAVSLVVAGLIVNDSDESTGPLIIIGGAATYVLSGPVIHLAHGQLGRSFGSLALRVGLPVFGAAVGIGMVGSCSGDACIGAALVGGMFMIGGVVAASVIDDGFLGKVPKARPKSEAGDTSSFRARLAPFVAPKQRALGLSLVGTL
jgi:hypothetical protein